MSTTPLIVGGVLEIGATDFSDAITKVILQGTADEVEIPATLATPKTSRKGGVKYQVQIDYLSNDKSGELFDTFWTALTSGDGELDFTVKLRDGAVGVDNPIWSGTMVVLSAALGGEAEGLSSDSITFPLTGEPDKATS